MTCDSGHANEINMIKCNRSGTRLASCSDDMSTRIWNVENLPTVSVPGLPGLFMGADQVLVLRGHIHSVSTLGWCPPVPGTNELLVTYVFRYICLFARTELPRASFDGTARLWDSVTGQCLKVFSDHRRPVYALAVSPDGSWLATGSGDGWLHVYDLGVILFFAYSSSMLNSRLGQDKEMVMVCWCGETWHF